MQIYQEITRDGLVLRGMLHRPAVEGKVPFVVMFHDFCGNRIEFNRFFWKIARYLEQNGIASIRFDFAGSGESDGNFSDMCLRSECADGKAILDYAKTLDFVDTDRLALFGFGLGGLIASILAPEVQNDIRGICLCSPAFGAKHEVTVKKEITHFNIETMERDGYVDILGCRVGPSLPEDIRKLDMESNFRMFRKDALIVQGLADQTAYHGYSEYYAGFYPKGRLHTIEGADHHYSSLEQRQELYRVLACFFQEIFT